jgi:ribose-phosphate pyrophosphokinase
MGNGSIKIFSGSSHPDFARAICGHLDLTLGRSETVIFQNDNQLVKILENVRGADVYYVQTSCPPVDRHLMEMLIAIDALKGASAARVTAVIPYFPYVRSDKKDRPRISITARLVADLIQTAGADRVLTMDLHSPQIQGFFRIPCDQLTAMDTLCGAIKATCPDLNSAKLVSGDVGASKATARFGKVLGLGMAIIVKERTGDDDKARPVQLIGDVSGTNGVITDDEAASLTTAVEGSKFLLEQHGAKSVSLAVTHGVLCGPALQRLDDPSLERVIITDTVPLDGKCHQKINVVSVTELFAKAIRRIHNGDSLSDLFKPA